MGSPVFGRCGDVGESGKALVENRIQGVSAAWIQNTDDHRGVKVTGIGFEQELSEPKPKPKPIGRVGGLKEKMTAPGLGADSDPLGQRIPVGVITEGFELVVWSIISIQQNVGTERKETF